MNRMLTMMTNLSAFASSSVKHSIMKGPALHSLLQEYHRSSARAFAWTVYAYVNPLKPLKQWTWVHGVLIGIWESNAILTEKEACFTGLHLIVRQRTPQH